MEEVKTYKKMSATGKETFKCLILQGQKSNIVKNIVKFYYEELNSESGNILGIFYSKKELKKDAETVKKILKDLSVERKNFPCIYFWKDNIKKGSTISIAGLNYNGVYQTLLWLISITKEKESYKVTQIAEKCDVKVNEIRRNNEYQTPIPLHGESTKSKIVWRIIIPLCCSLVSAFLGGLAVYYITSNKNNQSDSQTQSIVCSEIIYESVE